MELSASPRFTFSGLWLEPRIATLPLASLSSHTGCRIDHGFDHVDGLALRSGRSLGDLAGCSEYDHRKRRPASGGSLHLSEIIGGGCPVNALTKRTQHTKHREQLEGITLWCYVHDSRFVNPLAEYIGLHL